MSRRLKHFKEQHVFHIKARPKSCTEEKIRQLVDECINIFQKYINKGHTLQKEIKQIQKKTNIIVKDNGLIVKLDIHVSHYTKLYFDVYDFIAKLHTVLDLEPSTISHVKPGTPDKININNAVHTRIQKDECKKSSMFIN